MRGVTSPSTTLRMASAFSSPQASRTMRSACMMVRIPMVMAILGVSSRVKNALDSTLRVSWESCTNRVRDLM